MEIALIFWTDHLPQLLITPVGALPRIAFTATEGDWKTPHEPARARTHATMLSNPVCSRLVMPRYRC